MLHEEILREMERIPVIDVHTHLNREQLAVEHPAHFMLYHMLLYELCAAGGPADLIHPWQRDECDFDEVLAKFLPYFDRISNTGFAWCLRTILKDLYDYDEPITADSGPRLRAALDRKISQPGWAMEVMRRGNIVRSMTSWRNVTPLAPGQPDPGLRFGFEVWPLHFQDRNLTHLKNSLKALEESLGVTVDSFAAMREAFTRWFDKRGLGDYRVFISWIVARIEVHDDGVESVGQFLQRVREGGELSESEWRTLGGAIVRAVVESIRGKVKVFQYVLGCEWIETGQRVRVPVADGFTRVGAEIAKLAVLFPDVHFDILNGYEPAETVLCSVAARMPNMTLTSMWWHQLYPAVMAPAWQRRIDMVPWTGLIGYFSDAYCVEWQYAKLQLTRRVLAGVLAERVEMGWMNQNQAIDLARKMLFETPRRIFLPDESIAV